MSTNEENLDDKIENVFLNQNKRLKIEKDEENPIEIRKRKFDSSCLLVNSRQRGNPILKYIRQVKWEYSDNILGDVDYAMTNHCCALFLSLKYHQLNPNYIYERLKSTKLQYQVKLLLIQIDTNQRSDSLKELSRLSLIYQLTILVSWSDEESARYLESYKIMEGKSVENLLGHDEQQSNDYLTQYIDMITQIKSLNKNDGQTLIQSFLSVKNLFKSSVDELSLCSGLGRLKAVRLNQAFNINFRRDLSKKNFI